MKLLKNLSFGLNKRSGRNLYGRITVYNKGGGHKKKYRILDLCREKYEVVGSIIGIFYDPNRSSRIALVCYSTKELSYILAPEGISKGDKIFSSEYKIKKLLGNSLKIKYLGIGDTVHNLEIRPNDGGVFARASGVSVTILRRFDSKYFVVKLPSGEERLVHKNCRGTVGRVINLEKNLEKKKKAGESRWLGKKPVVRGVAMNPVDHAHGGGEGKKSGKRLTPWGKHIDKRLNKFNKFIITKRYNVQKNN